MSTPNVYATFPFDFALLDPGTTICDLFVFNKRGANTVEGTDVLLSKSGDECGSPSTGNLNPMVGTRTSTAATLEGLSVRTESEEELRLAEDLSISAEARERAGTGKANTLPGVSG